MPTFFTELRATGGPTLAGYAVLECLQAGTTRTMDIAARLGVTEGNVTVAMRLLSRTGYATQKPNAITEKGCDALSRAYQTPDRPMTSFLDGPAAGQPLMLKRAPHFLRVTHIPGSKPVFDALDRLEDEWREPEMLTAYQKTDKPAGAVHINTRGKPGGGFFTIAEYQMVAPQPSQEVMQSNTAWQEWCHANKPAHFP